MGSEVVEMWKRGELHKGRVIGLGNFHWKEKSWRFSFSFRLDSIISVGLVLVLRHSDKCLFGHKWVGPHKCGVNDP